MPNQEEIEIHRELLLAHRQTLGIYLKQLALAGRIHAPPTLFHGINEARTQIRYLKAILRSWNEPIEDLPIDEEMPPITHAPAPQGTMPYERKHLFTILDRETLALGSATTSIFQRLLAPEFANCSIECYLRIVDDGGDPANWAGIRVRGFSTAVDDIGFGYLTYLRASGRVELYRGKEILALSEGQQPRDMKEWNKLRVDIISTRLQIWVNDEPQISVTDETFGGKGFFCLHTFFVAAHFKKIDVYELSI